MRERRFEVEARLEDGMTERPIGGGALQLVTLCLCDGPSVVSEAGEPGRSPVASNLRPDEARELAFELLALAELAERRGEAG